MLLLLKKTKIKSFNLLSVKGYKVSLVVNMEFRLKLFYFKHTFLSLWQMGILGRGILLKSDFPSVWRRVDTVKLYLHFFLIAQLMTGCFLRLRGKGGFTNCACCSRMIILLHLLNVSLKLFSVHTAFSQQTSIVLSCRWCVCRSALIISLEPHLECLTLIDMTFSVGILLWLVAFLLSSKVVWGHATHSRWSLSFLLTFPWTKKVCMILKQLAHQATGQLFWRSIVLYVLMNHLITKVGRVGCKSFIVWRTCFSDGLCLTFASCLSFR